MMSDIILKRCRHCQRIKMIPYQQRYEFHHCCEGHPMSEVTNMRSVYKKHQELQRNVRQWDFDAMRPKDNPHRPARKGQSKFEK